MRRAGHCGLRRGRCQLNPEARAAGFARAESVFGAHQRTASGDDRQPQAMPGTVYRPGVLVAEKRRKDVGAVVRRDTDAGIPHLASPATAAPAKGQQNAARPRIAQGVMEQIAERLAQQGCVGQGDGFPRRQMDAQRQSAVARFLAKDGRHVAHDFGEVHGFGRDPHTTALDPRQIEQGIEHLGGRTHALAQVGQGIVERRVAVVAGDRLDQEAHRVHRLTQVVAGRGQEQILVVQRLFGLLLGVPVVFRQTGPLLLQHDVLHEEGMRTGRVLKHSLKMEQRQRQDEIPVIRKTVGHEHRHPAPARHKETAEDRQHRRRMLRVAGDDGGDRHEVKQLKFEARVMGGQERRDGQAGTADQRHPLHPGQPTAQAGFVLACGALAPVLPIHPTDHQLAHAVPRHPQHEPERIVAEIGIPGGEGQTDDDHRPKTVIDPGESHVQQPHPSGRADVGVARPIAAVGLSVPIPLRHRCAFPAVV